MFTNSSNVNRLQNAFQLCSCGDNLKIKQGEEILKELNTDISYPILLFDFMTSLNTNPEYLLRASVEFKHWFERYKVSPPPSAHNLHTAPNSQVSHQIFRHCPGGIFVQTHLSARAHPMKAELSLSTFSFSSPLSL